MLEKLISTGRHVAVFFYAGCGEEGERALEAVEEAEKMSGE